MNKAKDFDGNQCGALILAVLTDMNGFGNAIPFRSVNGSLTVNEKTSERRNKKTTQQRNHSISNAEWFRCGKAGNPNTEWQWFGCVPISRNITRY